ncbi:MAG TPA: rhodanese-like domain-containing protein [Steroidobacteraceae bacterium]|nr:rhodanese-like domain-containing protein [Steroidobacteraceae bacterium]
MQQFLQYVANHYALAGAAVLMAALVLVHEFRARTAAFASVSPAEAVRLVNGGALLVDIRPPEAFAAGHIAGARNISSAAIADGAQALERFKEKAVIAYCDSGMTAGAAARHLGRLGFAKAYNLRGGLAAWRQENLPVVKG